MIAAFRANEDKRASWQASVAAWFQAHGATFGSLDCGALFLAGDNGRCFSGGRTVLHGWIDNAASLKQELGGDTTNPAGLYDLAVAQWGDEADAHIVGHYAAVSALDDGQLRLARSPWTAPPLSFCRTEAGLIAGSLPSLFAALDGPPKTDYDVLADTIAGHTSAALQFYPELRRVAIGSVVRLSASETVRHDWYDVDAIAPINRFDENAAIDECNRLLGEACRAALKTAQRPAIALSGGLDSPMVASELLRQDETLELSGITMTPDPAWEGPDLAGTVGDEWPLVQRFAAMHPRLKARKTDPEHGGLDHRFREIARIAGQFNPSQSLFGPQHGIWQAAREDGNDWLFTGDLGNQSFSSDGRWAYAETFRQGRWNTLLRLLRDRGNDPRPIWRQFFALGLLPHLPQSARAWVQRAFGGGNHSLLRATSMLSSAGMTAFHARAEGQGLRPVRQGFTYPRSRRDAARRDWQEQVSDLAETTLALELHYGVRYRDVTAYRPLIEYCLSLPTDAFIEPGQTRKLARKMARGRMPPDQHDAPLHGLHHVDWLVRLRRDAARLRQQLDVMREHSWCRETLDIDRMDRMLADLPQKASENIHDALPYMEGIGRALLVAQFIGIHEGRNDL